MTRVFSSSGCAAMYSTLPIVAKLRSCCRMSGSTGRSAARLSPEQPASKLAPRTSPAIWRVRLACPPDDVVIFTCAASGDARRSCMTSVGHRTPGAYTESLSHLRGRHVPWTFVERSDVRCGGHGRRSLARQDLAGDGMGIDVARSIGDMKPVLGHNDRITARTNRRTTSRSCQSARDKSNWRLEAASGRRPPGRPGQTGAVARGPAPGAAPLGPLLDHDPTAAPDDSESTARP